jgi:hypothetical protein
MAKMGSNLASNAWGTFSETFLNPQNFVAVPTAGQMQEILGYVFVNELCRYAYDGVNSRPGMIKVRAPGNPEHESFSVDSIASANQDPP